MSMENDKKLPNSDFSMPDLSDVSDLSDDDLDQYGVWVKTGPETVEDDEPDLDEMELSDLTNFDENLSSEEESLLGPLEGSAEGFSEDLPLEDFEDFSFPEEDEELGIDLDSVLEESSPDQEGPDLDTLDMDFNLEDPDLDSFSLEDPSPVETPQFDDVEAVEMAMTDPAPGTGSSVLAGDILTKIEKELATIKEELAELKKELSILKPSTVKEEPQPLPEVIPEEETGFFEDDEDETIALTGDELDNILNTADITEETGESDVPPEGLELELKSDEEPLAAEDADVVSIPDLDEQEAGLSVASLEELSLIEDYNRELDNFGAEEFTIDAEDAIDTQDMSDFSGDTETLEEITQEKGPEEGLDFDLESLEELPEIELPAEPLEDDDFGFANDLLEPEEELAIEESLDIPDGPEAPPGDTEEMTLSARTDSLQIPEELELEEPEEAQAVADVFEMPSELDEEPEDLEDIIDTSEDLVIEVDEEERPSRGDEVFEMPPELDEEPDELDDIIDTADDLLVEVDELESPSLEEPVFQMPEGLDPEPLEDLLSPAEETDDEGEELSAAEIPEAEELLSEEIEEVPPEPEDDSAVLDLEPLEEEVEVSPLPPVMDEADYTDSSLAEGIPENLKEEVKSVLKYMDQLLEDLPEEKIKEFARSEHFEVYRRLFEELGLE